MKHRAVGALMAGAVGMAALLAWSPLAADLVGRPASSARAVSSSGHPLSLVLERAPVDWHGRPVYVLINRSAQSLPHLVILSWEGDLLPLLHLGPAAPAELPSRPLAHPPYTLPSGWSVWFVGQEQPWPRYVVQWLNAKGVASYQVVSARLVSPA
ncbi:hypothetical protein [Alicyclobacillus fructus]|uniref:hypothetical protein n=1 Tax=Alicyclobacillus fructus TaxID=2816082 RepID=UPI001A8EC5F2|nr:hypothetical protein [Alicyclobacillus fructus]